jgi:hypothetical protein
MEEPGLVEQQGDDDQRHEGERGVPDAALHIARWGGGRGRLLFPLVILLGAAIAAVFANDGACAVRHEPAGDDERQRCRRLELEAEQDRQHDRGQQLVSANFFDVTFGRYAAVMVPVNLVSLAATLVVLGHPQATMNASAAAGLNSRRSRIASTIGVSSSAAPS